MGRYSLKAIFDKEPVVIAAVDGATKATVTV